MHLIHMTNCSEKKREISFVQKILKLKKSLKKEEKNRLPFAQNENVTKSVN